MYCKKCGNALPEDVRVCDKCGTVVGGVEEKKPEGPPPEYERKEAVPPNFNSAQNINAAGSTAPVLPQYFRTQQDQQITYMEPSAYSKVFVDPDEKLLGTLGNGYLANFILAGSIKKCHALLTDKRVYFQGILFSGKGGGNLRDLKKRKCEQIVDLEDISSTAFIYSMPIGILTAIISVVVPWILGFVCWIFNTLPFIGDGVVILFGLAGDVIAILWIIIKYILLRKTYFVIEYAGGAGGELRFDAKIVGLPAVQDFQKQIRRAKDRLKGKG